MKIVEIIWTPTVYQASFVFVFQFIYDFFKEVFENVSSFICPLDEFRNKAEKKIMPFLECSNK